MFNTPKVLIVDDSASSAQFMSQALRKAGYQVITAADGNEGLQKTFQERPHCLVLDVVLPGVSGYGICRQLRAVDPQHTLPIIMVSSKSTRMDQTWGLRQGADRYLPKPFTEEEFVQTVQEVMMEHHRM
jgi:DNA-binding response OmpR family regulator